MRKYSILFRIMLIALIAGCQQETIDRTDIKFDVHEAEEWNQLFIRTSGWFGADGIFAIPLTINPPTADTSKQMIIFSDTMIGQIKDSVLQKGYRMVNNSVAFLNGKMPNPENISFPFPEDSLGAFVSVFPVRLADKENTEYFWLGDGFLNSTNSNIYIFAYRVIDRPEWTHTNFKFEVLGGALIVLPQGSTYPFDDQKQIALPFFLNDHDKITSFGVAIYEDIANDFIYIYGTKDPNKQVLVGRVSPVNIEDFSQWSFWNGSGWSNDFLQAQAIADSASNELSVSKLPNGTFALISQLNGIYPSVIMRIAENPWGPFGGYQEIWDCRDDLVEPAFFAYNAKAHPSLSQPDELLVSYNINSFAFWDQIEKHPHLYRPRFFKLIFH